MKAKVTLKIEFSYIVEDKDFPNGNINTEEEFKNKIYDQIDNDDLVFLLEQAKDVELQNTNVEIIEY